MKRLLTLIALALLATIPVARAADTPFRIGYLEWSEDPRYRNERIKAEYPLLPWGRPFAAAVDTRP